MKKRRKLISVLLSGLMCLSLVPAQVSAATVLTENTTGTEDGYNYELWKDSGNTTMTLLGNGTFSCEWSNINNCLFRTGKKFDCTQTIFDIGNIQIDYEVDYNPNGNSYLCVYGWTRDPLVEYYIVESWGTWRPPGNDGFIETRTIDGATYDIYKTVRVNQPSIDGDTTFDQYWSVRTDKRTSGTINVGAHFAAWQDVGLPVGKLYEAALNVEGYQSSGSATVLKNELTVGGDIPEPGPTEPVEPDENGYYFHSTFEDGKDSWGSRGDATAAITSAVSYADEQALAVTGRTDTWNGTARTLTSEFVPGTAYSFSVMAMQNAAASDDFKLTLQYTDAAGDDHYDNVATATGSKGEWVQLANESFTIPTGAKNLLLYVETADSTNSFYIDEAIGAVDGTVIKAVTTPKRGDVNADGTFDDADIKALQSYLLGREVSVSLDAADLDGSGKLNVIDLILLKQLYTDPPAEPTPERVEGVWYNKADISWIDPDKPMVALAFDDGPVGTADTDYSIRIQNAISEAGGHATFFYVGSWSNANKAGEIPRAQRLGFEVASHTWSHPDLTTLSADGIREELDKNAAFLEELTGETDFLVRLPYLSYNDTVCSASNVPLISCSVDSQDWNGADTQTIISRITSAMQNGTLDNSIVLMHETYSATAEAVEYLAPYLTQQGYQIVTISEMFKANGKDMYNGTVYRMVS